MKRRRRHHEEGFRAVVGGPDQDDDGSELEAPPVAAPTTLLSPGDETGRRAKFATAWPLQRPSGSEPRPGHLYLPDQRRTFRILSWVECLINPVRCD